MSIKTNLQHIKQELPKGVTLVAVSKTKPVESILEAYNAGQRVFGENKVQEMVSKYDQLPKDISWHMIGHLQRNKVKYMAHFVDLIHGVDNLKLLKEINKQAQKHDRTINCLLQIKIATEDTKFGMPIEAVETLLHSEEFKTLDHIKITGLMGMASFTDDLEQIKNECTNLTTLFNNFSKYTSNNVDLKTISMGMSSDYKLAIQCGSTMVRIGSSIFGTRNYN